MVILRGIGRGSLVLLTVLVKNAHQLVSSEVSKKCLGNARGVAPGFQLGTCDFKSLPPDAPLAHWAPAFPQVTVRMILASWSCLFSNFWGYPFISSSLQARADGPFVIGRFPAPNTQLPLPPNPAPRCPTPRAKGPFSPIFRF